MATYPIEEDFKRKVCEMVRLESEGMNRFRVFTPFTFDDGDHLAIVLKRYDKHWFLSDEGHTYMHLSYELSDRDFRKVLALRLFPMHSPPSRWTTGR